MGRPQGVARSERAPSEALLVLVHGRTLRTQADGQVPLCNTCICIFINTYIHIYIYMCVCVCLCRSVYEKKILC